MTNLTSRSTPAAATAGPRQWAGLAVLALPTLLLSMDVTVLYLALPHLAAGGRAATASAAARC
ncbi:MAG: qacA7 [Nonomuraea muscovyensis]|nr:qacA7 [Nonomuraea muscovyensis]